MAQGFANEGYWPVNMSKIESLKQMIETNPDSLLAQFGLAKEYMGQEEFDLAATHFQEAIRIKPDYTAAFRFLGQSLEKGGKKEEAKQIYHQGIEVAKKTQDIEAGKIMGVFLKRLDSNLK